MLNKNDSNRAGTIILIQNLNTTPVNTNLTVFDKITIEQKSKLIRVTHNLYKMRSWLRTLLTPILAVINLCVQSPSGLLSRLHFCPSRSISVCVFRVRQDYCRDHIFVRREVYLFVQSPSGHLSRQDCLVSVGQLTKRPHDTLRLAPSIRKIHIMSLT